MNVPPGPKTAKESCAKKAITPIRFQSSATVTTIQYHVGGFCISPMEISPIIHQSRFGFYINVYPFVLIDWHKTMEFDNKAIETREILEAHLAGLVKLEPKLAPILAEVGEVPMRLGKPGFAGLASIVSSQLLSVASARAIHTRVENLVGEMSAENFLKIGREEFRQVGMSYSKIDCLYGVAKAELNGAIDFAHLHILSASEVMVKMTALKGIGPWSAEIYLISSIAHPDIFPAGDLVLQKMLGKILSMDEKPDEKQTRKLTKKWSPYRGSAARLLWRYFAVLRDKEGINL